MSLNGSSLVLGQLALQEIEKLIKGRTRHVLLPVMFSFPLYMCRLVAKRCTSA
jgi:hypothetical protein